MSRSRKKTPKKGMTSAKTEKENKRTANRHFRRKVKGQLKKGEEEFVTIREVSNVWGFGKDGKQFLGKYIKKDLRK